VARKKKNKNAYRVLVGRSEKKNHLEGLGVYVSIIPK
jgi:hypothetical protein